MFWLLRPLACEGTYLSVAADVGRAPFDLGLGGGGGGDGGRATLGNLVTAVGEMSLIISERGCGTGFAGGGLDGAEAEEYDLEDDDCCDLDDAEAGCEGFDVAGADVEYLDEPLDIVDLAGGGAIDLVSVFDVVVAALALDVSLLRVYESRSSNFSLVVICSYVLRLFSTCFSINSSRLTFWLLFASACFNSSA